MQHLHKTQERLKESANPRHVIQNKMILSISIPFRFSRFYHQTPKVVSSIPGSVGYISHVHWAYDYLGTFGSLGTYGLTQKLFKKKKKNNAKTWTHASNGDKFQLCSEKYLVFLRSTLMFDN